MEMAAPWRGHNSSGGGHLRWLHPRHPIALAAGTGFVPGASGKLPAARCRWSTRGVRRDRRSPADAALQGAGIVVDDVLDTAAAEGALDLKRQRRRRNERRCYCLLRCKRAMDRPPLCPAVLAGERGSAAARKSLASGEAWAAEVGVATGIRSG